MQLVQEKERETGVKMMEEGSGQRGRGRNVVELTRVLEIVCVKMNVGGEICVAGIELRIISPIMTF